MTKKVRSICVVGVDGTGKSSTIEMIKDKLGDQNVRVQYMGARLWETGIGKKFHGEKLPHTWKNGIMFNVSLVYEMYYRVIRALLSGKIIVFDRYVDELFLFRESRGKEKKDKVIVFFLKILFKWLFYKPQYSFYLTCPIEMSQIRKDDLSSDDVIKKLESNKMLLDDYYMSKNNVTIIDTSVYNKKEVLNIILTTCHLS